MHHDVDSGYERLLSRRTAKCRATSDRSPMSESALTPRRARAAGSPGAGRRSPVVVVAGAGRRSASPTSRCARAGTRSRTACSGARAPKASPRSKSRPGPPRRRAGIQRGDVLLAVNGAPVAAPRRRRRVPAPRPRGHAARVHAAAPRHARRRSTCRSRRRRRGSSMYFVLAAVGLFTLLVGASVRLRRPRDQATLHFFWLCVAFFGAFTFSFNGPFDRLDWVFYWGDAVAIGAAAAAAAALHAGVSRAAGGRRGDRRGDAGCSCR